MTLLAVPGVSGLFVDDDPPRLIFVGGGVGGNLSSIVCAAQLAEDAGAAMRAAQHRARVDFHQKYGSFWKCADCGAYYGSSLVPRRQPVCVLAACRGRIVAAGYTWPGAEP